MSSHGQPKLKLKVDVNARNEFVVPRDDIRWVPFLDSETVVSNLEKAPQSSPDLRT